MSNRLEKLTIRGFKTIRALTDFEPGSRTVFIGPNGAGKSNFVSFFRFLSFMLSEPGNLAEYVGQSGGASALLFDGPEKTREIEAQIAIRSDEGLNEYAFRLAYAAGDTLIFTDERYRFSRVVYTQPFQWRELGAGHREAALHARADEDTTARVIRTLLRRIIVHQFHNTSATARVRQKWDVEENRYLKEDGGNLAPFLYRLRENEPKYYRRIVDTLRLILPFFADFELEPDYGRLLLSWRERQSDLVFNASQASDGMLRTMALVALLLQPEASLPDVLILDEPELGLHPYAISVVGGLIRSVSTHAQVIVATQSPAFVNEFDISDIVVVERRERESVFRRLEEPSLSEWLEDYTLSELWDKNVLGGRP